MGGPRYQLVRGLTCFWLVVRTHMLTALCHPAMTKLTGASREVLDASW